MEDKELQELIELLKQTVEHTNNYFAGLPYKKACRALSAITGIKYVRYWVESGEWKDEYIKLRNF